MDKIISMVEDALISAKEGCSEQLIYKKLGPLSSVEIKTDAGIVKIQVIDNDTSIQTQQSA